MGNAVKKIAAPITGLFEPPKPPKPAQIIQQAAAAPAAAAAAALPQEPPARADEAVQEAGDEATRRLRRGRGRASTIITALSGGELPAGSVIRKALLGGN